MDCRRARELNQSVLDAIQDGHPDPLSTQERRDVEVHRSACPSCRSAMEGDQALFALLAGPEVPPPPGVEDYLPEGLDLGDSGLLPGDRPLPLPWQWVGAILLAGTLAALTVFMPAETALPVNPLDFQARALHSFATLLGPSGPLQPVAQAAVPGILALAVLLDLLLMAAFWRGLRRTPSRLPSSFEPRP